MLLVILAANTALADESREIPLSSMTTTSGQKGLQHTTAARGADGKYIAKHGGYLDHINRASLGPSNIFMVDAPDIDEAVAASSSGFLGGRSADQPVPVNRPDPQRGTYWLVAYLGLAGSSPANWTVESVTVTGSKIRFAYHKSKNGADTKNSWQYIYWVPLGILKKGTYDLELYDSERETVRLVRKVDVN